MRHCRLGAPAAHVVFRVSRWYSATVLEASPGGSTEYSWVQWLQLGAIRSTRGYIRSGSCVRSEELAALQDDMKVIQLAMQTTQEEAAKLIAESAQK